MNDRDDAAREIRRMKTLARALWIQERTRLVSVSGPGFARFSDKRSAGTLSAVVDNALLAGCAWADIEKGIRSAASDPRAGPWSVFDHALNAMSEREAERRQATFDDYRPQSWRASAPDVVRINRPDRVTRGLRGIGDILK